MDNQSGELGLPVSPDPLIGTLFTPVDAIEQVPDAEKLQCMLRSAQECSQRGLYQSAKWATELAVAIQTNAPDVTPDLTVPQESDSDDVAESLTYMMARTYFDLREYGRAAHTLRQCSGRRSVFLRLYAMYLVGEKRKEENTSDLLAPLDHSSAANEELSEIKMSLMERETAGILDGYGYYLLGLVYGAQNLKTEAVDCYLKAINKNPGHWGSWLELANFCSEVNDIESLKSKGLPRHWMVEFFFAYVAIELHQSEDALDLYLDLSEQFPKSSYLKAQIAVSHYNRREFDDSEDIFEQLRKEEPHRMENVDIYSNILYVKEAKTELSYLAHEACQIEQYRAETCCVIGNYYSLKNRHEKAVIYFQRALKLNRKYLSAWTLMGHEYVELKNSTAAIEAYRRAVDINPRDYRAWYGLGQTYELLKMPLYSLYYYRQAQKLRPYDARMWSALAHTYRELGRWHDTIKCYERTIALNPEDTASLFDIAVIYRDLTGVQDLEKAAHYFEAVLELHGDGESEQSIDACDFLSKYHREQGSLEIAEKYARRLMNVGAHKHKETAKSMLSDIHSTQDNLVLPSPTRGLLTSSPNPNAPSQSQSPADWF